MAKKVQFRGGSTLAHNTFKGAEREITVDTDKHTVVVHDNVKLGGYPLAKDSDVIKKDSDTGSAKIPVGTTAQRTANPTSGLLRHNSELNRIETYDIVANSWVELGGGSGGGTGLTTEQITAVNKIIGLSSTGADIDRNISYLTDGIKEIGFISSEAYTKATWQFTSGNINNNIVTLNTNGSMARMKVIQPTAPSTKYILVFNIDSLIYTHPTAKTIEIYCYSKLVMSLPISNIKDKKIFTKTFTTTGWGDALQIFVNPSSLNSLANGTNILKFTSNFMGFVPYSETKEKYLNILADKYTYPDFKKLNVNSSVFSSVAEKVINKSTLTSNDFSPKFDVEMFLSGGQSLNMGDGASSSFDLFSNTKTFAGGSMLNEQTFTTQAEKDLFTGTGFVDFASSSKEVQPPLTACIISLLRLLEDENNVDVSKYGSFIVPFVFGKNGSPITVMNKGTTIYNNMLYCVAKAKEFANKSGKTFGVRLMTWYQGEDNNTSTEDAYYALLSQLFIDVNTDIKAITGQAEDIQFFTYQTSAWMPRLQPNINVQEAQIRVANDFPNVHMCGAMYQFRYVDGFHPTDRANVGLQTGIAIKRVCYDNKTWVNFKPISHTVFTDGTKYYTRIKFDVPVKPMRFDLSGDEQHNIRGKEVNFGFKLLLAGVEKQTAEPFIVQGDTLVLTSLENPVGMTVQYAVNGHEGGGNLCDSQSISIRNKNTRYTIDNFAVSFSKYIIS